jgi:hypothetical protein
MRMAAMQTFLDDFDADLAVCSHFLFLYSAQLGEAFHHAALHELCRISREVRVFPLVAPGGAASPFVFRLGFFWPENTGSTG